MMAQAFCTSILLVFSLSWSFSAQLDLNKELLIAFIVQDLCINQLGLSGDSALLVLTPTKNV